jgi:hypothetical protein
VPVSEHRFSRGLDGTLTAEGRESPYMRARATYPALCHKPSKRWPTWRIFIELAPAAVATCKTLTASRIRTGGSRPVDRV